MEHNPREPQVRQKASKDSPDSPRKEKIWKQFIVSISLVVSIFVVGVFLGLLLRNTQLIQREVLNTARSYFDHIVLTRRWNAQYGGVFVKKTAGIESNPYLEKPDIHTADGQTYTKKNPALMTREISVLAERDGLFKFHITSLRPLNPDNKADEFEAHALRLFETGTPEYYDYYSSGDRHYFKYMAPLKVEKSCLTCHGIQGYKVGAIRGGISVTSDITGIHKSLRRQNTLFIALSILTALALMGIIYFFIGKLSRKLAGAYQKIEIMAITDELTRLFNRRYFFQRLEQEFERCKRYRKSFCCILIDIDHFKKVNDTHGHLAGDIVLREIGLIIKEKCRTSDVVGRYGGEEIALVLPETELEGACSVAEKLRASVKEHTFTLDDGTTITITISLGVACMTEAETDRFDDFNEVVRSADEALYRAKESGRDRVVSAAGDE